jgi:predicted dehydrogenase
VGHAYLQPGIADVVFAHLTYADNVAGHIHVSWLDPNKTRRATIVGTRKMLIFDDISVDARLTVFDKGIDQEIMGQALSEFPSYAEHRLIVRAGDAWLPRVDGGEPLALEIAEFAASIESQRPPLTDGWHGVAVVRTLERLAAAMQIYSLDASPP